MYNVESVESVASVPVIVDPFARQPGEAAEAFADRMQALAVAARREVTTERVTSGAFGENIKGKLAGNILTLTIDLSHRAHKSASGKSDIVATTGGNMDLGNGIKLGVNCYRK
jgi:hypothetical protein